MPYGRRGGEIVVSKQNAGSQYAPSIAGFDSGGFIVVWWTDDALQDGAGFAIKAQRFDSLGNAVGDETLVNSGTVGHQRAPSVTTLSSGGYVVTWDTSDTTQDGSGRAIKGQLFDSSGLAVGPEFRVNSHSVSDQTVPAVTGLAGGGFVVTWETADSSQDGHSSAIKGQIYSAAGLPVGSEFLVNTGLVGSETTPDVTSLTSGGFIATWTLGWGQQADIYAQVFNSSGVKIGNPILVNSTTPLNQGFASVTEISGGRFVVTWESSISLTTYDGEIRARIFNSDGTPIGNDFLVSTTHRNAIYGTLEGVSDPNVENLPGGGFVITWTSAGLVSSVRGQFFDASGNRVGTEVLVSTVTDRHENKVDIAVDGNGMLFTVWGSGSQTVQNYDIRGQLYSPGGAPEIVSNGGADAASVTVQENQSEATIVSAVDPDSSGTLVYSIAGGLDASRFAINASTGALTFVSPPNFEWRSNHANNNIYDVVVSVSDGVHSDIQALAVTVSNVNEAPTISQWDPSDYFHRENGTAVATFSATDPDGTAPTWSIAGGPDAALFAIDAVTGALRFIAAPNFEAPADAGANNFYNVTIAASDGSLTATKALIIEIANLPEGPVIVSGGGGDNASYSIAENTSFITRILADDPDTQDSTYSFSIVGGADAALFTIHAPTGQLSFRSSAGANFEAPGDAGANNVYDVIVAVSDGFAPADTQALAITVTNANDAPVITSNGGGSSTSLSLPENQLVVTTVTATDIENAVLVYSITGGVDAAHFAIDRQTGVLSFVSAPDREAPMDTGANNNYNVIVTVSDGDKSDAQALSISILDSNEAPVITSNGGGSAAAVSVEENEIAVTKVAATDPEGKALSFAISGGVDAARFTIDSATGALSFVAPPDHEDPRDSDRDNVYEVTVTAGDGVVSDTQALSVTVTNLNFVDIMSNGGNAWADLWLDENQTFVTIVQADDDDGRLTYSISGDNADYFTIDSQTGELHFTTAPDYETPGGWRDQNIYYVTVTASDGTISDSQDLTVYIEDVPEIELAYEGEGENGEIEVSENGTAVTTLAAIGASGPVTYEIVGGDDAQWFVIDASTGILSFASEPNFEKPRDAAEEPSWGDLDHLNLYRVVVRASDGAASVEKELLVRVQDVDEAPEFYYHDGADHVALSVAENTVLTTRVRAYDPDRYSWVTYSLEGADAALFEFDPYRDGLKLRQGLDFEAPLDADGDNVYEVTVVAHSGALSSTQSFSITIGNDFETVSISSNGGGDSATVLVPENSTAVTVLTAIGDGPVHYEIVGGAQASWFTLDPYTGELSFVRPPNYEGARKEPRPGEYGLSYDVVVSASNGGSYDEQTLTIRIQDVDEAPRFFSYGGAADVALTVDENVQAVATAGARDPDHASTVTYAIAGGADSALFEVDPTSGVVRLRQGPDFEAPADSDGDNVYQVTVAATSGAFSAVQGYSIAIADVDETVFITSNGGDGTATVSAAENGTIVTNVAAASLLPVTYSIVGGADSAAFTIDASTGALAFVEAPDFEARSDSDSDNVFEVIVRAGNGMNSDDQKLSVRLTNVNEGVAIRSGDGAQTFAVTVGENDVAATTVIAADSDGDPLVYSIAGGADALRFAIDGQTGVLTFVQATNFEAPGDSGGDNVYDVVVSVTDGDFTDSQSIAVTVGDLDEAVSITSGGGGASASVAAAENGTAATVVAALDPDGGPVTYAIAGGADSDRFTIDPETGVLTFVQAPDFEAAGDSGGDNVYDVIVSASDGSFTDSQSISVTVLDIDEPVEILSFGGAASVALTVVEDGLPVADVDARDGDGSRVTFSITGGADAGRFRIDPDTGVLSFIDTGAPDFEDPADSGRDNVYDVVVTASSATSSAVQAFAVTVANRNEGLRIESDGGGEDAVLTRNEGERHVTTVIASDRDGTAPVYSIVGGADAALFAIDPATGILTFVAAPDHEAPHDGAGINSYVVEVGAGDGEFMDRQTIRIGIADVNEAPAITSGGGSDTLAVTVDENGLAVTQIAAGDVDGDSLTYSIAGGADSALFTIDARTGALRFLQAPNFEAPADSGRDNVYNVVVSVTDGSFTDSQAVAVTVSNLAELVAITSNGGGAEASVAVAENGRAVATVAATSADGGGAVTYAIAGGADASRFTIDPGTGVLAFVSAPNFEAPADSGANNVYDVVVSATNGATTDTQALAVRVENVNEPVTITSNGGGAGASVSVAENGTAVTTVVGADTDGGPVTYSIAGGADSARFTIDSATGVLAFRSSPDFEAPADLGGDNVYDVVVRASDGSFADTQAIAVTVGNANEAPIITSNGAGASGTLSVAENSLAVTVVTAVDPDRTNVTYSIAGGADAARFTINSQTGVLQFVNGPDWELPADSDGDNVYSLVVRASDGQLVDHQVLNVAVTNIRDGNVVTATSGNDSISDTSANLALRTSNEEDLVFGRDGHDSISGMAGDDEIYGEGGHDELFGGDGADKLSGGLGKDQFTYNAVAESNAVSKDLILDFSRSQGDKISLGAIDANSLVSGNQAFTFIGTSAFSNTAGQLRYETSAGITTIFGDVNGDGTADLQIQLSGSIPLIASDFIL